MKDLVIGQTYSREEVNAFFGAPADCECRIVFFDENGEHHCEVDE